WTFSFTVEGRPAPAVWDTPSAVFRTVFPGYFRTLRIPIVRGRDISERDDASGPHVVVINQSMARRWWPGEDAVGKRIQVTSARPWYSVAGVVKDSEQREWGASADSEFYFPMEQIPGDVPRYLTVVARTAGNPLALAGAVQNAVWSLDRS